ncbi:MAG: MBL fold metallo-hydrolase [Bacillota bacterium]
MSKTNYYEKGIKFWNRGYIKQADKMFSKYLKTSSSVSAQELKTTAEFCIKETNDFELGNQLIKLAIQQGMGIKENAKLYLESLQNYEKDDVDWLYQKVGVKKFPEILTVVAKKYFEIDQIDLAYQAAIEGSNKLEFDRNYSRKHVTIYQENILLLVQLEYLYNNLNQARFQLRKLFYLEFNLPDKLYSELIYWSILLDEVNNLLEQYNFQNVKDKIKNNNNLLLLNCYLSILNDEEFDANFEKIKKIEFSDEKLEYKRQIIEIYLAYKLGRKSWQKKIKKSYDSTRSDLWGDILYAEMLPYSEEKRFWKNHLINYSDKKSAIENYWNCKENTSQQFSSQQDITILPLGGGENIGASSFLISKGETQILLDAGMYLKDDYLPAYDKLEEIGFSLSDIDYLFISHAHLDHTGSVPYVYNQNKNIEIYTTQATQDLMRILLEDTIKLSTSDKMYDSYQLNTALSSINSISFDQKYQLSEKLTVTYYPAGHILGAAAIHLDLSGISLLYTGDFSVKDQYSVEGLDLPDDLEVDILISESTYGFNPINAGSSREQQEKLLVNKLLTTVNSGTALIPAFAVGRAQEIILLLKEKLNKNNFLPFDLFLDGRVVDVCFIYQQFADEGKYINSDLYFKNQLFYGNGIQIARDYYEQSEDDFDDFFEQYINCQNNCIIASSGMLADYSTSSKYAARLIEEENNSIIFSGYLDEETPGGKLEEVMKSGEYNTLNINQEIKEINSEISSFKLSAHASRAEITNLVLDLKPKHLILVHGDRDSYSLFNNRDLSKEIYPSVADVLSNLEDLNLILAENEKIYNLGGIK